MSVRGEFLRCLGEYARIAEEVGLLRIEIHRGELPAASVETLASLDAALPELRRLGAEGDLELAAALTRRVLRGLARSLEPPGAAPAGAGGLEERRRREHLDELCRVILGEPSGRRPGTSGAAPP